jgi:hypothetical protein
MAGMAFWWLYVGALDVCPQEIDVFGMARKGKDVWSNAQGLEWLFVSEGMAGEFLLRSSFGEAAGRPRSTRALLLAGTTDAFPPVRVTIAFAKGRGEAAPYQWLLHFELCNSAVATPVGALYKWLDITSQWRRDA